MDSELEADRRLPLAPFLDLFKGADVPGGDALVERIGELARQVPEGSAAQRELARRQLFDEHADTLLRDSLLVFEDLHWSDEARLDGLLHLARRAKSRTCLLVTYRDDEANPALASFLAALDRARLAVDVPLPPLTRDEVAAMAQATEDTRLAAASSISWPT